MKLDTLLREKMCERLKKRKVLHGEYSFSQPIDVDDIVEVQFWEAGIEHDYGDVNSVVEYSLRLKDNSVVFYTEHINAHTLIEELDIDVTE